MSCVGLLFTRLSRKKYISAAKVGESNLRRCLGILDLTALGIGSTLGLGIYVLAGQVAKESAGPAVMISFLIAAIASVFAGLCYAEFGARVPRAGSAYVYSYVSVGEFVAFIIGWNLILEYVIGAASVARGYSGYFDGLINKEMSAAFAKSMPMNVPFLASYPDFFAFGITMLLTVVLSLGVKESSKINNVLTVLNLLVVVYTVICGAFRSNVENWEKHADEVPSDAGTGGFMPFGISGVLAGAATCFYGFVGFDCIATTGEEAKNPQRAIPIAIVLSLAVIFMAYFGVSTVVTLMVPYYDQDETTPIPTAFQKVGYPIAAWVVSIGALFGLSTSLLGAMFPLPRVLYAMSNDGLIFRFLSKVSIRFKTPVIATMIAGLFAACMALLFDLDALVEMMSIGTLLAYTLVAASVLILRYKPDEVDLIASGELNVNEDITSSQPPVSIEDFPGCFEICNQIFNAKRISVATTLSGTIVVWGTLSMGLLLVTFNAVIIFAEKDIANGDAWAIVLAVIFGVLAILNCVIIGLQPPSKIKLTFKVPWVPLIPALSIFVNTYLMLKLNVWTWMRFAIWMVIGLAIYFLYGMWFSTEEYKRLGKTPPNYNKHWDEQSSAPQTDVVMNGIVNDSMVLDDMAEKSSYQNVDISSELPGSKYSEFSAEKSSELLGEKSSEILEDKSSEILEEKSSELLDEKSSDLLDEQTSELSAEEIVEAITDHEKKQL